MKVLGEQQFQMKLQLDLLLILQLVHLHTQTLIANYIIIQSKEPMQLKSLLLEPLR